MMDANAINEIINDRKSISRRNWDEKSSMINPINIEMSNPLKIAGENSSLFSS